VKKTNQPVRKKPLRDARQSAAFGWDTGRRADSGQPGLTTFAECNIKAIEFEKKNARGHALSGKEINPTLMKKRKQRTKFHVARSLSDGNGQKKLPRV